MGNAKILRRGDVQMTSAGTGISQSEGAHGKGEVHLLQFWATPSTPYLRPQYYTRHFSDEEKTDCFVRIVATVGSIGVEDKREAEGPALVHSAVTMYATLLSAGKTASQAMKGRKAYIHVVMSSGYVSPTTEKRADVATIRVNGEVLGEGDGAYIFVGEGQVEVRNVGERRAEVVLLDLE